VSRANNFVERMAAGRDRAAHLRHRGLATGGKARMHPKPNPTITGWEYDRQRNVASWKSARADVLEGYRRAVFPDRYEYLF
jgi:hypothetical protein